MENDLDVIEKKEVNSKDKGLLEQLVDGIQKSGNLRKESNSVFSIPMNIGNRRNFDGGNKPKIGRKYVLKCTAVDGKRAYFTIEHQ